MKTKIAYLISISLAVIASFTYLSARLEIHYAEQSIASKNLEIALLKQQTQHLSVTEQLSSPFPMQLAMLEERIEYQQAGIEKLQIYANHWVFGAALLLWAVALMLWYRLRKQLSLNRQAPAVGWRLWLARILFYSGMALLIGAVLLSNGQGQPEIEVLWLLISGLVLIILGVALRVSRRVQTLKK